MKPENRRIIERSYLGVKSVIGIIQIRKYPGQIMHNFRNIKIYLGHLDKYLSFY